MSRVEAVRLKERRKHPRVPLWLPVKLRIEGTNHSFEYVTKDAGPGGIFIKTNSPLPRGTHLTVQLYFPSVDMRMETKGLVVRSHAEATESGAPGGMAIRFIGRESLDGYLPSGTN